MKEIKIVLFFLFLCTIASAQTPYVEVMPQYPGGEAVMYKFLYQNIRYPEAARENNIQGKVVAQFVVMPDGSLDSLKILRCVGGGCDEEVIRVINLMPKWNPGTQDGKAVPVYFNLPVTFKLADDVKKPKKHKHE